LIHRLIDFSTTRAIDDPIDSFVVNHFVQWFVRPILKEEEIAQRLEAVAFFASPERHGLVGSLHSQIRLVKDLPRILVRLRKAMASVADWNNLTTSIISLDALHHMCLKDRSCERVSRVAELIVL